MADSRDIAAGGGARNRGRWVDRLLPDSGMAGDSDERMRQRLLVRFSVVLAATTLPLMASIWLVDPVSRGPRTISVLGILIIGLNPLWLRLLSTRVVALLTTGLLHALILVVVVMNGGVFGPSFILVASLPVITVVLVSLRAAWIDGGLLLVLSGLLLHIDATWGLPRIAPAWIWPMLATISAVLCFAFILVVVTAYTGMMRQQAQALRKARDYALAASQAKSRFLSVMSHELRTPLVGVLGTADLLATHPLGEEPRRLLAILQRSAHAQLELIGDILDLSRIEANRLQLEQIPIDPRALVGEAAALFLSAIEAKGLSLRQELDPSLPAWFLGDPLRLRQVLGNLLSNALKFTERGVITLSATALPGDPPRLRFSVADTGIGIPADKIEHILEDFTQAEESTSRRFGGSGLGLAICRRLMAAMGGTLAVHSGAGQGSLFAIEVPAPPAAAPPVRAEPPRAAPAVAAPRPLMVLVTDDDPISRVVVSTMLERLGHSVVEASGGAEALEILKARTLDLVLLDVHMPDLDGPATARAIRGLAGPAASVPILGMTADAAADRLAQYLASGFTRIVSKPIAMERLAEALGEIVGDQARTAVARAS